MAGLNEKQDLKPAYPLVRAQLGGGNQELPGVLWKSSEVFERFVWYLIHRVIRTQFVGVRVAGAESKIGRPFESGCPLALDYARCEAGRY